MGWLDWQQGCCARTCPASRRAALSALYICWTQCCFAPAQQEAVKQFWCHMKCLKTPMVRGCNPGKRFCVTLMLHLIWDNLREQQGQVSYLKNQQWLQVVRDICWSCTFNHNKYKFQSKNTFKYYLMQHKCRYVLCAVCSLSTRIMSLCLGTKLYIWSHDFPVCCVANLAIFGGFSDPFCD